MSEALLMLLATVGAALLAWRLLRPVEQRIVCSCGRPAERYASDGDPECGDCIAARANARGR